MNELTNKWMNEWMNEWLNEWVTDWMNKWMNNWTTDESWNNETFNPQRPVESGGGPFKIAKLKSIHSPTLTAWTLPESLAWPKRSKTSKFGQ